MIFHFVRFKFFKHRIHYWLRLFVVIRDTAFKFVRTNVWEEASKKKKKRIAHFRPRNTRG